MIGVLGSGFGLYGHLPALVELGLPVTTLSRYREAIEARPELAEIGSKVAFTEAEADLLEMDVVVLARRPQDNLRQARLCLSSAPTASKLVIEKPVAPTPADAEALLRAAEAAGTPIFTPFLLRWCNWAGEIRSALRAGARSVAIDWTFSPGGSRSSWKSDAAAGGGLLNFYFIHVVALVVELCPDLSVEAFTTHVTDGTKMLRLAVASGNRTVDVRFSSAHGPNLFQVVVDSRLAFEAETPFGPTPRAGRRDPRIGPLKRFYAEDVFGTAAPSDHGRIVQLWKELSGRAPGHAHVTAATRGGTGP